MRTRRKILTPEFRARLEEAKRAPDRLRKLIEGDIPDDAAKEAADEFIKPVITGLGEHYGARTKLAELLSARAGKPISRNRLTRWLKDDVTKREMPSLGNGLLLRAVFDEHKDEICQRHNPWNKRPERKAKRKKKPNKKETT